MDKLLKPGRPDFIPREFFRAYLRPRTLNQLALIDGIQPVSYVNREVQQGRPFINRHSDGERCHGIAYRMIDIVARARAHGHSVAPPPQAEPLFREIDRLNRELREVREKVSVEKHHLAMNMMSHALTGARLLLEGEIVAGSVADFRTSGVYFLIKSGTIQYVGQSVNVFSRIDEHRKLKSFDSFSMIRCEIDLLDVYESLYIHILRPPLNGRSGREGSKDKHAPLSFDDLLREFERVSSKGKKKS